MPPNQPQGATRDQSLPSPWPRRAHPSSLNQPAGSPVGDTLVSPVGDGLELPLPLILGHCHPWA